jgi:inorganic pyrophosphatase
MTDYLSLPVGSNAPELINAVVEIPLGSNNKYEYDKALRVFRLDRRLYSAVHFPGDYGFIPSTISVDSDPLDVLILAATPSFTGCLTAVRPIGLLETIDQSVVDEKILAVAQDSPRYSEVHEYCDIYPHLLKEIEHFFGVYKDLEGKRTKVVGWENAEYARKIIMESHQRYVEAAAQHARQ